MKSRRDHGSHGNRVRQVVMGEVRKNVNQAVTEQCQRRQTVLFEYVAGGRVKKRVSSKHKQVLDQGERKKPHAKNPESRPGDPGIEGRLTESVTPQQVLGEYRLRGVVQSQRWRQPESKSKMNGDVDNNDRQDAKRRPKHTNDSCMIHRSGRRVHIASVTQS